MEKTGNKKNSKTFHLLQMCMKYFCQSTYNQVRSDVPNKNIYLVSQNDELFVVSVQISENCHSNVPAFIYTDCIGKVEPAGRKYFF